MNDQQDTFHYHSRRSIDELVSALTSENPASAHAHKELSLLHLQRFAAEIESATKGLERNRLSDDGNS